MERLARNREIGGMEMPVSLGDKQAELVLRALKEYKTLLQKKQKELEKQAKQGIIGAPSEYARITVELADVDKLIARLEKVIQ